MPNSHDTTVSARSVTSSVAGDGEQRALLGVLYTALQLTHGSAGSVWSFASSGAIERVAAVGFAEPATGIEPILKSCVATGALVRLHDAEDSGCSAQTSSGTRLRALLLLPLYIAGDYTGVLLLAHETAGHYDALDTGLLSGLQQQAAVALENARLLRAEQRRRIQAEALRTAGLVLSSSLDLDSLLSTILDQVGRVVPCDSGGFFLADAEWIRQAASRGVEPVQPSSRTPWVPGFLFDDVARSRGPVIIEDVRQDPRWTAPPGTERVRAWLGVPLIATDELVGFLTLDKYEPSFYTTEHAELAEAFAAQAALAIKNAELYRSSRAQSSRLQSLYEVGRAITSTMDLQSVIRAVADAATTQSSFPMAALALVDAKSLVVRAVAGRNVPEAFRDALNQLPIGAAFAPGTSLARVLTAQRPAVVPDMRVDTGADHVRELALAQGLLAAVTVPLVAKGRFEGILTVLDNKPRPDAEQDVPLLEALADHAAIAIANARLYESTEESLRQTRALQRITSAVAASLDLPELLQLAIAAAIQLFGADRAAFFMLDDGPWPVRCIAAHGLSAEYIAAVQEVYRRIVANGSESWAEVLYVADATTDPRIRLEHEAVRKEGFRSMLTIALRYRDQQRGAFVLYHDQLRPYSETEIGLARTFADQAAIAIEHARLFEQTRRLAAVEERGRLARELHDSVTQTLFSVSLITQALPALLARKPQLVPERLARLDELAHGALAEMRSLIADLRPASLEREGLEAALRKLSAGFEAREGLAISVQVDCAGPLSLNHQEALYRITQEALNNVAKHAQANTVVVSLYCDEFYATLLVEDDGIGITTAPPGGGFGMTSMRERAALLGGTIVIERAEPRGTRVQAVLPLLIEPLRA